MAPSDGGDQTDRGPLNVVLKITYRQTKTSLENSHTQHHPITGTNIRYTNPHHRARKITHSGNSHTLTRPWQTRPARNATPIGPHKVRYIRKGWGVHRP